MGHLSAESGERFSQAVDDPDQQGIELEGRFCAEMSTGVEPPELGLALGVYVVVDVEQFPSEDPVLIEQCFIGVESGASLRRDNEDRCTGKLLGQERLQLGQFRRFQL